MLISQAGNVGIGTNDPNIYGLSFTKQVTISNTSSSQYGNLTVAGGSGASGGIDFGNQSVRHAGVYGLDGSNLGFYTNGSNSGNGITERMRITSGGNVGIGTTSVFYPLVVNGIVAINGASELLLFDVGNVGSSALRCISGSLHINTNATANAMYISSGGNVGIGTTSPGATYNELLQVSKADLGRINVTHTNTTGARQSDILFTEGTTIQFQVGTIIGNGIFNDQNWIRGVANLPMVLYTNDTERMRITSGGQISQTTSIADWSHVITNASTTSPNGIIIQYTAANKNNTGNPFLYCTDNSGTTLRFEVRSNGGIANYQANDVNLSDIRTKKDITPLGSYWDKFKAIEMVKFKYKDQTHDDFNIGVIAQQLEKVAPEFVDVDGWGNDKNDKDPLKSIYTADLHHATIKVLQEAMAKIEDLQNQLDTLKNK
jgi:hypothetical protein